MLEPIPQQDDNASESKKSQVTHKEFFAALEKIQLKFKFKVFNQEQALDALEDLKANFDQYSDECQRYYYRLDHADE